MTNTDNDSPLFVTATTARSKRRFLSSLNSALFVLVLLLVLLGDVLTFNQLATQSPTDALLQLLVFAIGGAGIVEFLRRLLAPTPTRPRASALIPGALGSAAIVAWRAQLPLGISVIITSIATIICGILAFRLLWGASRSQQAHVEVLGLLGFAQTIVFGYVAVLAAVDGGSNLFG